MKMQKHALEIQNSLDLNKDGQPPITNPFQSNFNEPNYPHYEPSFNTNQQYGSESGDNFVSNNSMSGNENSYDSQIFDQMNNQKKQEIEEPDLSNLPNVNFSQPPPGFKPDTILAFQNGLPDLSKPPPGFIPFPEFNSDDLLPSVPYFELPAGLMVPLIMVSI